MSLSAIKPIIRASTLVAFALAGCGREASREAAKQRAAPSTQQIRQSIQEAAEACSTAVSTMDDALTAGDLVAASSKARNASEICNEAHEAIAKLVGTDQDDPYSDCVGMALMGKEIGDKTAASLAALAPITDDSVQRLAESYRSAASLCLIAAKRVT